MNADEEEGSPDTHVSGSRSDKRHSELDGPARPATTMNNTEPKNVESQPEGKGAPRWQFTLRWMLAAVVVCALIMALFAFAQRRQHLAECSNRLKHIGLALHNYHSATDSFPAAYVADDNGRALYSWRPLVDPYSEFGLRGGFLGWQMDQPWNSPFNSSQPLFMQSPDAFKCPLHEPTRGHATSYAAVNGPDTAWPGEQSVRLGDITDGASNTILIVELPDSDIHWMEPRDLDFAGLEKALKKHGGLRVLFADGRVGFIPASIPRDQLKALVTIAGGEEIDEKYLPGR